MRKWIIAPRKGIAHLITMDHVTEAIIDEFVVDFAAGLRIEAAPGAK